MNDNELEKPYDYHMGELTYDITINNDINYILGLQESEQFCKDIISIYNSSNSKFFKGHKGQSVSIVCNETDITVYTTIIQ